MNNVFFYASSKSWNKSIYDQITSKLGGEWHYIDSKEDLKSKASELRPRYIFFQHWNWIVPDSIWSNYECVCFHMTDVPFGRGGSPLQNLIIRGFKETRLTALRMVKELDAGPVYLKSELELSGSAEEIYLRASLESIKMIEWIIKNEPSPLEQSGEPTFFKRRTPEESKLEDLGELEKVYDFIRMLDAPSYPKAFIDIGGFRVEFDKAKLSEEKNLVEGRFTIFKRS